MTDTRAHAALMDSTYRYQRLFYDITRRYYLLGRDRLVADLAPPSGARVLEIACGTGRNLERIARHYPGCALFGLDISHEMLRSAHSKLGGQAVLARADACDFDGDALFGAGGFDRVVMSYSLSMIPDWGRALRHAAQQLRPGGELHVVDFGDQDKLPRWFRRGLHHWLSRFHVTPRRDLLERMQDIAQEQGMALTFRPLYRDYARYGVLTRPAI
ncbi:class I SAM-dependent methyltransferase [Puniceibacterium sediminis]|uniref:S-adenosylmethionine-diacylgycerolhomoserine-N-methlytransferase n=1 Tax=Puniceibacterium sediminis TaxID=1608407 RepID=A0A238XRK5_9RHOB|nr:class I SAM-dependent methyltransferase [Puniceibacterium sediminis]SNR60639.1 S-adenosylmethionine-diacylgycerolhomoserine-N-methlytransferase [Puniceibacterium sediminis]